MIKLSIRRGDTVRVIAGNERGKEGKILQIFPKKQRAIVEGCRLVKRHLKPTSDSPQGKIETKESTVHISNLMLIDPNSGNATRVGRKRNDNNKLQRYAKKTGNLI